MTDDTPGVKRNVIAHDNSPRDGNAKMNAHAASQSGTRRDGSGRVNQSRELSSLNPGCREDLRSSAVAFVAADGIDKSMTSKTAGAPQPSKDRQIEVSTPHGTRVIEKSNRRPCGLVCIDRLDGVQNVVGASACSQDDELLRHGNSYPAFRTEAKTR